MNQRKSLLPLIEILISTGIFAIAVILTLQLFMLARFLGFRNSDMADAILKVQYVAETLKSLQNNEEMDEFLNDLENDMKIYYDINWERTGNTGEAVYVIEIQEESQGNTGSLYLYEINLYKIEPYPFINDKALEQNPQYRPLLASINAGKFIAGNN
jgi:mannose-6-phosphate isomerase class I